MLGMWWALRMAQRSGQIPLPPSRSGPTSTRVYVAIVIAAVGVRLLLLVLGVWPW